MLADMAAGSIFLAIAELPLRPEKDWDCERRFNAAGAPVYM